MAQWPVPNSLTIHPYVQVPIQQLANVLALAVCQPVLVTSGCHIQLYHYRTGHENAEGYGH